MRIGQTLSCGWMACCCLSLRHQMIIILCVFCLLSVSYWFLWSCGLSHTEQELSCLLGRFQAWSPVSICTSLEASLVAQMVKESACNAGDPESVFLPGEFHGQRSLAGYSPWGRKEWDTTQWISFHFRRLLGKCLFLGYTFWSNFVHTMNGPKCLEIKINIF